MRLIVGYQKIPLGLKIHPKTHVFDSQERKEKNDSKSSSQWNLNIVTILFQNLINFNIIIL